MSDREYLRWLQGAAVVAAALLICIAPNPARAYVEAPMTSRRHHPAIHQHRPDAGREGRSREEPHHLPEGPGHQRQAPGRRDQAQHRPRRPAAGRVGRDHEVGGGRQAGHLLPQRRRQRDVHRRDVVPGLPAGRVVGHVARRAVPAALATPARSTSSPPSSPTSSTTRKSSSRAWWTATRKPCTRRPPASSG